VEIDGYSGILHIDFLLTFQSEYLVNCASDVTDTAAYSCLEAFGDGVDVFLQLNVGIFETSTKRFQLSHKIIQVSGKVLFEIGNQIHELVLEIDDRLLEIFHKGVFEVVQDISQRFFGELV
jgi:hypothetical protein